MFNYCFVSGDTISILAVEKKEIGHVYRSAYNIGLVASI